MTKLEAADPQPRAQAASQRVVSAVDRARKRKAEASSAKSAERAPGLAVDGEAHTRWTSVYADDQWLTVDLGQEYMLARIEIRWEKACAKTYLLQGSVDGKQWVTFKSEIGHEGWVRTALPPDCKARWVRMYGQRRATQFGFSIYDFRVYSLDEAAPEAPAAIKGDRRALQKLPAEVADDVKWLVWNVAWQAANATFAAEGPAELREQKLSRAAEDGANGERHFQAALDAKALSAETLEQFRLRSEAAGRAAAAAARSTQGVAEARGATAALCTSAARVVAAGARSRAELAEELWKEAEEATGLAAAVVAETLREELLPKEEPKRRWRVVEGEGGGLEVREDASPSTEPLGEKLSPGAVVEEEELTGGCLRFSKVSGAGPARGWIAVRRGRQVLAEQAVPDLAAEERQRQASRRGLQAAFEERWRCLAAPPGAAPEGLPPRPLTTAWLAAHGVEDVAEATEEELPQEMDEGMSSACSLLLLASADGSGQREDHRCVVKRPMAVPDLRVLRSEHLFYTEAARCNASPLSPPRLAGALRLPRVLASSFGPEGWEAQGSLLVMECLDRPEWARVEPEAGLPPRLAHAAVAALGRVHVAFASGGGNLERMPWLPVTPLDLQADGSAMLRQFRGCYVRSAGFLQHLLPASVREACLKMCHPAMGLPWLLGLLAKPPSTLLHGDFRTENLRFSASESDGQQPDAEPEVAAFDWGMVSRGRGALDLGYFLALSLQPDERRAREDELVDTYLAAFEGGGAPSKDELWGDLRVSSLCLVGKLVLAHADFHGPERAQEMLDRSLRWAGAAAEDWDAGRALQGAFP